MQKYEIHITGSGTTAFVAEKWGRRWITCDTSRIAITIAKQRLMTAVYDYYELSSPEEGVSGGVCFSVIDMLGALSSGKASKESETATNSKSYMKTYMKYLDSANKDDQTGKLRFY